MTAEPSSTEFQFTAAPPLALYVHIPWCVRKCPYCDFNSHAQREPLPERAYVDALLADLDADLLSTGGRHIETVFIGGGTPSLFSPESIARLMEGIRARVACAPDWEVTLEANPGTVEQGRFTEFYAAGINRLSIGVQSFDDDLLQRIGRIHGRREAIRAAEQAHAAGFASFNLDLMYALPEQTLAQSLADVSTALDLEPAHISHYQLTLEPNTAFHLQPPTLPDEDLAWQMMQDCQSRLAARGYTHYEVSAYARDTFECRHNLNYWTFGDYLGIGAGAHAKLTDVRHGNIRRTWKQKQPKAYLAARDHRARCAGESLLSADDATFEFMLNALRLVAGFDETLYGARTGLTAEGLQAGLRRAQELGLLQDVPGRIQPSQTGRQYLNELMGLFLSESDDAGKRAD